MSIAFQTFSHLIIPPDIVFILEYAMSSAFALPAIHSLAMYFVLSGFHVSLINAVQGFVQSNDGSNFNKGKYYQMEFHNQCMFD